MDHVNVTTVLSESSHRCLTIVLITADTITHTGVHPVLDEIINKQKLIVLIVCATHAIVVVVRLP